MKFCKLSIFVFISLNMTSAIGQIQFPNPLKVFKPEIKTLSVFPTSYMKQAKIVNNEIKLSVNMTTVVIGCSAPYPIEWSFNGYTSPLQLKLRAFREKRLIRKARSGEAELDIFRAEITIERVSVQLTGNYTCKEVNKSLEAKMSSVHIYGAAHNYRGQDPILLEHGKTIYMTAKSNEQEVIFPCAVWDKKVRIELYKRENGSFIEMNNNQWVLWDPKIGFRVKYPYMTNPYGNYLCTTNFSITFDRVRIVFDKQNEFLVKPSYDVIEFKEHDTMELECESKENIEFEVLGNPNAHNDPRISFYTQNETVFDQNGYSHKIQLSFKDLSLKDEGDIVCKKAKLARSNNEICRGQDLNYIHKWHYQVISSQDKSRRGWKSWPDRMTGIETWACWSKTSVAPSVGFVSCTNSMECQIRGNCFNEENRCDPIDARACSGGCTLLTIGDQAGILKCKGNGVDAKIEQYIGISKKHYRSKEEMPFNDTISAECGKALTKGVVETFEKSIEDFTCQGSSFLFAGGFLWDLVLKDNSSYTLTNEKKNVFSDDGENIAILVSLNEEFYNSGNLIAQMKLHIMSKNVKRIRCRAPYWDSFDWANVYVDINVKEPQIESLSPDSQFAVIFLGDTKTLNCDIKGFPKPKITWLKDDASKIPKSVEVNETFLHFPEVQNLHSGIYRCVGWNEAGEIQKEFNVQVNDPNKKIVLIISISSIFLLSVSLLIFIILWKRIQKQKKLLRNLTEEEIREFEEGSPEEYDLNVDRNKQGNLLAYNMSYEFPKENLVIMTDEKLGSGAFGQVTKGIAKGLFESEDTLVAVKTMKSNADIIFFKSLLVELKIMSSIGRHVNIVNLLGACTREIRKREIFIITEFCSNGCIEDFLRSHREGFMDLIHNTQNDAVYENVKIVRKYENQGELKMSTKDLIMWSYHIACGMEYLSYKKVIHGDLAARNVLLDEQLVAKIGDFGLSRQLYEYSNYIKKQESPLPWRWMAIESLRDLEFSTKSDVWGFGVTLWEIFSLGEVPYPAVNWTHEFLNSLLKGYRLPNPKYASNLIYKFMSNCWRYESEARPCFSEIANKFRQFMEDFKCSNQAPPEPKKRTKFDHNGKLRMGTTEHLN